MICEGENDANGCHLAGFGEDVAFARHFVTTKKLSKMAGNSASYSPNSWWVDRL